MMASRTGEIMSITSDIEDELGHGYHGRGATMIDGKGVCPISIGYMKVAVMECG
jgi:hypothetical protein